jgi:hypothetical protein
MPGPSFFDWQQRLQNTELPEFGLRNLYSQGDFAGILRQLLQKSNAYQNLNPFYMQYLLRNADAIAAQQQLQNFASSNPMSLEDAPTSFLDYVTDWIGGKTREGGKITGLGFMAPAEGVRVAQQALANLHNLATNYPTSEAGKWAWAILSDPKGLEQLTGMLWSAYGPSYGGLFRNQLARAFSDSIMDLAGEEPDSGSGFYNYLSRLFGANPPQSNIDPNAQGLTSVNMPGTPAEAAASAAAAANVVNEVYNPTLSTGSERNLRIDAGEGGYVPPAEPATTTAQKTLSAPDVAQTAKAISGQRPGGRPTLSTGEGNSSGTVRPAYSQQSIPDQDISADALRAAMRLAAQAAPTSIPDQDVPSYSTAGLPSMNVPSDSSVFNFWDYIAKDMDENTRTRLGLYGPGTKQKLKNAKKS